MAKNNKFKQLWLDFKKFISRGSVIDMAIGVVIGGAFSAIVNAVVKILTSLCAWAVPGGINGLVTVLPPITDTQKGLEQIGESFSKNDLGAMVQKYYESLGFQGELSADMYMQYQSGLLSKYTLYGETYVYNQAALIDWGTVINAVISFLMIAIFLFIVLKVYSGIKASKKALEEKIREEYYKAHPEERPVEEPEVPAIPEPTEKDYLRDIANSLKSNGRRPGGRRHF